MISHPSQQKLPLYQRRPARPVLLLLKTLVPSIGGLYDRTTDTDPTAKSPLHMILGASVSVTSSRPSDGEQPASDASLAQKTGRATTTDLGMNRASCRCCCARPLTTLSPSVDAVAIISLNIEWTQSIAWALLNCSRSSLPGVYIWTRVWAP